MAVTTQVFYTTDPSLPSDLGQWELATEPFVNHVKTIPNLAAGLYYVKLRHTNGLAYSDFSSVFTVNISEATNQPPVVNAGADQVITEGTTITLTANASDTDGTVASYLWALVVGGAGIITSPTNATTTVTGLTAAGSPYVFQVTVTDNEGAEAFDEMSVTVNPAGATTPEPPTVTGNDSTNTLTASHALGTSEILVSENGGAYVAYSGVIAVGDVNRAAGYWKFKIKSATGRNESAPAGSPAFTAAPANGLPSANAGTDQTINAGDTLTLSGGGSDAEGAVSYQWTQIGGGTCVISTPTSATTTIKEYYSAGAPYTFRLTVTDSNNNTATDDVAINITPEPNKLVAFDTRYTSAFTIDSTNGVNTVSRYVCPFSGKVFFQTTKALQPEWTADNRVLFKAGQFLRGEIASKTYWNLLHNGSAFTAIARVEITAAGAAKGNAIMATGAITTSGTGYMWWMMDDRAAANDYANYSYVNNVGQVPWKLQSNAYYLPNQIEAPMWNHYGTNGRVVGSLKDTTTANLLAYTSVNDGLPLYIGGLGDSVGATNFGGYIDALHIWSGGMSDADANAKRTELLNNF